MDFLKKGKELLNKSSGSSSTGQAGQPAQNAGASTTTNNTQQSDYGDKAMDFIAKKSGYNIDRNTSEKITDAGRGLYEKQTGKKVDPKWSN